MKTKILSPLRRDGFKAGMVIISVIVLSAVLTACSSDDSPMENAGDRVAVKLAYTTVTAAETRAAQNLNEGTFASGEAVTVRISNTNANSWTDYTFTTADTGAMTAPNPAPYYPAGTQNIDIAAYYPATAGTSFTVATDQTTDANYKASDLMFASVTNQAKQADAVNLAFSHKMAKLCVNITAGAGVTSISSVSVLNVKPTVTFDQATGAVGSASGDATNIAMSNNGAAVFPAQTIDGGLLSIVTDKGTATYSVASKEFVAGKLYTINITVNLSAINTTTAITGWTSEGTVNVNPLTVLNATADHVGWLITSDGYVYQDQTAVNLASKTAAAMICYVGAVGTAEASGNYRGLAIALKDANSNAVSWCGQTTETCMATQYASWNDAAKANIKGVENTILLANHASHTHSAATAAYNYSTSAPTGTSGWFLPTIGQWNLMVKGLLGGELTWGNDNYTNYKYTKINEKFNAAGLGDTAGDPYLQAYDYWSSTEYAADAAWVYHFYGNAYMNMKYYPGTGTGYVRAVVAF